jgi:hypothetical protein
MSKQLLMHGEPDAWKPARPVRGMEKLASVRGYGALSLLYSTFNFPVNGLEADMHDRH